MPIRSTRRGFYYQDLCAVNQFLKHYLEKDITSLFVDFEYDEAEQKSFDIKIITRDMAEVAYEVKAGDTFKDDRTLISETFTDLIGAIKSSNVNGTVILIVSPEFKAQVANYWSKLIYLQTHATFRTQEGQQAIGLFASSLPTTLYDDNSDLQASLKLISVVSGESAEANGGERISNLCHVVMGQIGSLAENLGIDSPNSSVFREEMLMHQFIYAIQTGAGTNVDLMPEFRRLMVEFFARYRMQTQDITPGTGGSLDISRQHIEQKIEEFENPDAAVLPQPGATDSAEGGVILGEER